MMLHPTHELEPPANPARFILKEHQAGASAADLCRKHGVSDATFYKWRSKYGGKVRRETVGLHLSHSSQQNKVNRPSQYFPQMWRITRRV
jgi:transposase-like protein